MRNLLISSALAMFSICFTACKKDDATKAEILTSHNWQVKSATISPSIAIVGPGGLTTTTDFYNNGFPACQKDDFYTFFVTNDAIRNEGTLKCGAVSTVSATWAFLAGETQLQYTEGSDTQLFSIVSIKKESIVLTSTFTQLNQTYTVTWEWVAP